MQLLIPALNSTDSFASISVDSDVFDQKYNETLVHQLITKYLANSRSGTKAQKSRSEVSGGGAKPWRQKGTGRARSGTTRSPIWRTGGVTFASKPRNYDQKLNKKMFRVGLRSIFSELLRQERINVYDDIIPSSPKTKEFKSKLIKISANRILVIVDELNTNLILASRNIINTSVNEVAGLNPLLLVSADKVVITSAALKKLEELLK
jgi:large subunit ribosomal protein L4